MVHWLLLLLAAFVVAAVAWCVAWMITGRDGGLDPVEPDGVAIPLPNTRPLTEHDVAAVRFDTALRGYRMAEVDAALRRAAYDIGYKEELINVLEAEIAALRDGRSQDAEVLRVAREDALKPVRSTPPAKPVALDPPPDSAAAGSAAEPAATRPDTTLASVPVTGKVMPVPQASGR